MKTFIRVVVLTIAVLVAVPAVAQRASSLYSSGRDAEARRDYLAAYDFYRRALEKSPKELKYRTAFERMRFQAAMIYVNRGQKLREQGKLQEALALFERAMATDASSFIAEQEYRRTKEMIDKATPPGAAAAPSVSPLAQRVERASGPADLAPINDAPITLNITEDTKTIYSTIGKLAGINVLFDPDYTSRRIRIELQNVTLTDALELIALQSKTFWRAVTPNTIFIAADSPAKRRELEQHVLRTFYFSNLSTQTELQDVNNVLRSVLNITRATLMVSQNAIVVRGTPDQLALAEKLINDLDKPRSEVIVEVAVMQVNRTRLRDLGIQPPSSVDINLIGNVATTNNGTNQTTTSTTNTTGSINLNRISDLSANDFILTTPVPTARIAFLMTDGTAKLIQNPQLRALDGQKASLKIGDRVPVATGSFGGGLGGIGLTSLVNTQFNYIDVGVNIDITPHVHVAREVSMKIMLDVSSVTRKEDIGGLEQPVIGQRKIEHEIRLKEGESSLLGGIFEEQDIRNMSGWPWLSQVPILKYFFSSETIDRRENEIVFVLTPHIVRSQDISPLNMKSIDIGTDAAIDIRSFSSAVTQPRPAGSQAPQTPGNAATAQARPAAPPQQAEPQPAATQPAVLSFNPVIVNQSVGQTFAIDVNVAATNLYSVPLQISYDPRTLQLVNVSNGTLLSSDGQAVALVHRDDAAAGSVQVTATRPPNSGGVSGDGSVVTLTFMAKAAGQSAIVVTRAGLRDAAMQSIPASGTQAQINIK